MAGINLGTAFLSIVPEFRTGSRQLQDSANSEGGAVGKTFAIAAGAAIAASVAIGAGLKKAYDIGSVFDDVADTIRAGTGKSGAALQELSTIAKTVATTIPTSFEAAGATVTGLSQRLGLTGDNLTKVSEQFLQAGAVLGEDVDINSATKALSVFGVQGDQVSAQMDNLFRVAQSTGVGMNELTAAAAAQAPALQELGFGFQDTVSLIGSLEKAGLNSTAVTASMGKGLVKLAKDGEQPQEAFQRITGQLGDLVKAGDTASAIDLASGIFGTKGATQFVGAIKSGTLDMAALSATAAGTGDTILGVGAETADAAESWTLFKNKAMAALEPVGTAVFGLAGTGMKKLTDSFDDLAAGAKILGSGDFKGGFFGLKEDSPVVGALIAIHDTVGEIVGIVGGQFKAVWDEVSPILGQVGAILGPAIVDVFNTLKPAVQQLLPIVMQLLPIFNPVSLIFKALLPVLPQIADMVGKLANVLATLVAGALKALAPLFQKVVEIVGKLIPVVTDLVVSLLPPLMKLFEKLVPVIEAIIAAVLPVVDALISALMPAIDAIVDAILPLVGTLIDALMPAFDSLIDAVLPLVDTIMGILIPVFQLIIDAVMPVIDAIIDALIPAIDAIMPIVERAVTFIADSIGNLVKVVKGIIDFITGVFTGDWDKAWTGIKEIFGGIWDQIKNIVTTAIDLIVEFFTNLIPKLWDILSKLLDTVIGWGVSLIGWLWDGMKTAAVAVWDWFKALPATAWAGVVALAGAITRYGVDFIMWIKDGIVAGGSAVFNWFTSLPAAIGKFIVQIGSKLLQLGKDIVGWIVSGVAAVAGDIWNAITAALTGGAPTVNADGTVGFGIVGGTLGGARGAVVPGRDPGRRDNVLARLASGQLFGLRSEEAIMVPEFTHGVGGERGVNALNRLAEQGRLGDIGMGMSGFAAGGVIGSMKDRAKAWGGELAWWKADELVGAIGDQRAAGAFSSNGNWGPVNMNGFAANTAAAKAYIEGNFTGVSSIGGLYGGSVPGSDHPLGKALDVMIANYLSSQGIAAGTKIADWFINNPNSFGTKYVIWRDRINQGGAWSPYSHPSGNNDTLAHRDHVHLSFLTGTGEFSGGVSATGQDTAKSPWLRKILNKLLPQSTAPAANYDPAGGWEQWRSTVLQGLALIGQPAGLVNTVLNQIRTESSGNPRAINLTDSNAMRGTPSKGLIQAIDSTFNAYRLPGLSADIYEPLSNIVAGMRYAIDRYGSIANGMRGVAYDQGGWMQPGGSGFNYLTKPEAVLTPLQSDALVTHAKALEDGFNGRAPDLHLVVNLDSSDPLQVAVGHMIEDAFVGAAFEGDTIGAQRR